MASEILTLETFLKTELSNIGAVTSCVGNRIANSVASPNTQFPFLVITVIPLRDDFGQARFPIQTNCLVDIQIVSTLPLPLTVDPAVEAIKTKFGSPAAFETGGKRISIRHDTPILRNQKGASAKEIIQYCGGTYRVWIS